MCPGLRPRNFTKILETYERIGRKRDPRGAENSK
jgi:hypothetical protein